MGLKPMAMLLWQMPAQLAEPFTPSGDTPRTPRSAGVSPRPPLSPRAPDSFTASDAAAVSAAAAAAVAQAEAEEASATSPAALELEVQTSKVQACALAGRFRSSGNRLPKSCFLPPRCRTRGCVQS